METGKSTGEGGGAGGCCSVEVAVRLWSGEVWEGLLMTRETSWPSVGEVMTDRRRRGEGRAVVMVMGGVEESLEMCVEGRAH